MFVLAGKSLGYSPPVRAVLFFDSLEGADSGLVLSLSDSVSASRHILEPFGKTLVGGGQIEI
jgi:hypothetical protein